jgi:hypothetical protein
MTPASAPRLRWLRIAAITVTALVLASCRGLPSAAVLGTAAVSHAIPEVDPAGPAVAALPEPHEIAPPAAAAALEPEQSVRGADAWQSEVRPAARRGWDQDRVSLPGMPCRMLAGRVASRPDLVQSSDRYPSVILRLFLTKTLIINKRMTKTEGKPKENRRITEG